MKNLCSTAKNGSEKATQRLFSAEGSLHIYSNIPTVLTPAELYQAKENSLLKNALNNCNIYIIATRKRILIDPNHFFEKEGIFFGDFWVQKPDGFEAVPFQWAIPKNLIEKNIPYKLSVSPAGTHLFVVFDDKNISFPVHLIVSQCKSFLIDRDTDLDVLYIGQAIGKSKVRSAVDRLLNHSTFQRILCDMVTFDPQSEILLLLYQFGQSKMFISTGGDMNAEPLASADEERAHLKRMSNPKLTRHSQIALAEAGLIRYFQPCYNTQLKSSDFSNRKKIKIIEKLLTQDLTGLIVEICTANVNSRLRTDVAPPVDMNARFDSDVLNGTRLESTADKLEWAAELHAMAHSHFANFPLTTSEERDTFMHGMVWCGETEREDFMKA